jgi:hypothetical protein
MEDNATYNLLKQYEIEHKSLWRITKHYIKEAKGDKTALAFWKKLEEDKKNHLQELKVLIKARLK